jgi:hypothetical protein
MNQLFSGALDVGRLAADYSAAIRSALSPNQFKTVVLRDSAEHDPIIEHANEFTDTYDSMAAALSRQLGDHWSWCEHQDDIQIAIDRAKHSGYCLKRVLVACEFSGTVRDEFKALGHDVISCDLLPTDKPGRHYQGDVRDILNDGWHMMLAFPPCRFLCSSGLHWNGRVEGRAAKTEAALDFVRELFAADIEQSVLENSVGCIGTRIRPADQWIQPNEFGHDASKNTGLWLHNLPLLAPTEYVKPRWVDGKPRWANQLDNGQNRLAPSPDRWKIRAKTYLGIAKAFAHQYGRYTGALQTWQTA